MSNECDPPAMMPCMAKVKPCALTVKVRSSAQVWPTAKKGRTSAHRLAAVGNFRRMRLDVFGHPTVADRQVLAMLTIEAGLDLAAAAAVRRKVDHLLAGPAGFATAVGFTNVARWM